MFHKSRNLAAMANPIQQGLKPRRTLQYRAGRCLAAMANPIQQGLKHSGKRPGMARQVGPQWLIQYNKD